MKNLLDNFTDNTVHFVDQMAESLPVWRQKVKDNYWLIVPVSLYFLFGLVLGTVLWALIIAMDAMYKALRSAGLVK